MGVLGVDFEGVEETMRQALVKLVLAAGLWAGVAAAQTATSDTVYHLQGQVVNGVTGKPVARALVSSPDRRLATMSDGDGRFSFDLAVQAQPQASGKALIAGRVLGGIGGFGGFGGLALNAQKPEFLAPESPLFLPLDETLSTRKVELKLIPAASLSGRVLATSTDSPHGVRVMLLMHQVQEGERVWQQVGTQTTNTRGEFHFSDLRPGEYTAMTMEWRGDQPQAEERLATRVEYPPVFYGDVPELDRAALLHLKFGEAARLELHLHQANYYPVTVPVATAEGQRGRVNVRVAGTGLFSGYQLGYNGRDRAVEGWLPGGTYQVILTSYGQPQGYAAVPLHVAGGALETGSVALGPARDLKVRVRAELTGKQAGANFNVHVMLRPEDRGNGILSGNNHGAGTEEFAIANVVPGRYVVTAQPGIGYAAAVTSGGVDLTQHPLVVGASGAADPLEVTVRDDGGSVSGKVLPPDGASPRSSFLFLLPTDASGRFTQGYAGPDGSFTVENVAPGSYRLIAVANQRTQIPYRDAVAMRAYAGKGATLTVAPSQRLTVDVPPLDEGELPQ